MYRPGTQRKNPFLTICHPMAIKKFMILWASVIFTLNAFVLELESPSAHNPSNPSTMLNVVLAVCHCTCIFRVNFSKYITLTFITLNLVSILLSHNSAADKSAGVHSQALILTTMNNYESSRNTVISSFFQETQEFLNSTSPRLAHSMFIGSF